MFLSLQHTHTPPLTCRNIHRSSSRTRRGIQIQAPLQIGISLAAAAKMLSSPGGWIDNTPPSAFYYNGPVCKKVIIYCCYYLSWTIHLCVFTGQSSSLFISYSARGREDGYFHFIHTHATNPPGTVYLYFRLFFFLKHVHELFLHAGNGARSMRLFIWAADRRLKMTVNEGLIPLGTLQNPIPSTEISSFQLSYLSYLYIFS